MKFKQVQFTNSDNLSPDGKVQSISVQTKQKYVIQAIDLDKLEMSNSFSFEKYDQHFKLTPRQSDYFQKDENYENIIKTLTGVLLHIKACKIQFGVDSKYIEKLTLFKNHKSLNDIILGSKSLVIPETQNSRKEFRLFYFQEHHQQIKRILQSDLIACQEFCFSVDKYLKQNDIPRDMDEEFVDFFLSRYSGSIEEIAADLQMTIEGMSYFMITDKFKRSEEERAPKNSIRLLISGNRQQIFELYKQLQNLFSLVFFAVIQINSPLRELTEQQRQLLKRPEIRKINGTSYLLIRDKQQNPEDTKKTLEPQQIKSTLEKREWGREFQSKDLLILKNQFKQKNLQRHMAGRYIEWDHIRFSEQMILVTANRAHWQHFDNQLDVFLKMYEEVPSQCLQFNDATIIQIFLKYYEPVFKKKYYVSFYSKRNKLVKKNYQKNKENIENDLDLCLLEIRKELVRFTINQLISEVQLQEYKITDLVTQRLVTHQPQIGYRMYEMEKTIIKVKSFDSSRVQATTVVFLVDDRLSDNSYFHEMCKIAKIDFQNFVTKAMAPKKPDRLRKYLTPSSPFSEFTILFHLGLRNRSQTFERDLYKLIEDYQEQLTFALMSHDHNFYSYCLPQLLEVINSHAKSLLNNNKFVLQLLCERKEDGIQFYRNIEDVFKASKKVKPFSYGMQKEDIYQLYLYQRSYLQNIEIGQNTIQLSKLQSYCVYQQIFINKSRAIISDPTKQHPVEYLFANKEKRAFMIQEDHEHQKWNIQEIPFNFDKSLSLSIEILNKYLKKINYMVFYGQKWSGTSDRSLAFCDKLYITSEDQCSKITFDHSRQKIKASAQYKIKLEKKPKDQGQKLYEVQTHKNQLYTIKKCLEIQ